MLASFGVDALAGGMERGGQAGGASTNDGEVIEATLRLEPEVELPSERFVPGSTGQDLSPKTTVGIEREPPWMAIIAARARGSLSTSPSCNRRGAH